MPFRPQCVKILLKWSFAEWPPYWSRGWEVNSLRPGNAVWHPGSGPTYVQIMTDYTMEPGHRVTIKTVSPGAGISIIKIRRSWDRLIFIMEILYWKNYIFILRPPLGHKLEQCWSFVDIHPYKYIYIYIFQCDFITYSVFAFKKMSLKISAPYIGHLVQTSMCQQTIGLKYNDNHLT